MAVEINAVHDLSVTVRDDDVTWCLAPNVKISRRRIIGPGEHVNAEDLHAPVHFGTHLDFPYHMIDGGGTCEQYPVSDFIGRGVFIDLADLGARGRVEPEHLQAHDIRAGDIVLINFGWWKLRGENDDYLYDFPGLGVEAAEYLASLAIKGVGSDAYCIEHIAREDNKGPFPAHIALNRHDIWAIEGLDDITPHIGRTDLTVTAFPIKLAGVGGSPARVVAIEFANG